MGGQNHQPCGKYLPESTRLSQDLSNFVARVNLGNSQIEEIILGELTRDRPRSINGATMTLDHFVRARAIHLEMLAGVDALLSRMEQMEFQDSRSAGTIDVSALERALEQLDMLPGNNPHWHMVVSTYRRGGFRAVFAEFRRHFTVVGTTVGEIIAVCEQFERLAAAGTFTETVESNQLPLRQAYNRLLTRTAAAHEFFRCSSLLSTELYYMDNGHSTFVEEAESVHQPA